MDDDLLDGRMIFAFGAPRSGTFLLHRVLAAHPDVAEVPSETFLFYGLAPFWERFHHGARESRGVGWVYADPERLRQAARALCDAVLSEFLVEGVPYLVERTPQHARYADLIATIYPDARLVHIVRDGRDVARSIAKQTWSDESLAAAAEEWRDSVLAARRAADSTERYVEVRYEALARGGEEPVRELYRRVGLRVDEPAVEAGLRELATQRNIDPTGGGVAAAKWRTQLTAAELELFDEIAGDLLHDLGYPPSTTAAGLSVPASRRPSARARARQAIRRLRPDAAEAARLEAGRRIQSGLRESQLVADTLMTALLRADATKVRELFAVEALVRVTDPEGERDWRGAEAARAICETVQADPAFANRQIAGQVHPGIPNVVMVLAYALEDGGVAHRTLALQIAQGRIEKLQLYRFPDQPSVD